MLPSDSKQHSSKKQFQCCQSRVCSHHTSLLSCRPEKGKSQKKEKLRVVSTFSSLPTASIRHNTKSEWKSVPLQQILPTRSSSHTTATAIAGEEHHGGFAPLGFDFRCRGGAVGAGVVVRIGDIMIIRTMIMIATEGCCGCGCLTGGVGGEVGWILLLLLLLLRMTAVREAAKVIIVGLERGEAHIETQLLLTG